MAENDMLAPTVGWTSVKDQWPKAYVRVQIRYKVEVSVVVRCPTCGRDHTEKSWGDQEQVAWAHLEHESSSAGAEHQRRSNAYYSYWILENGSHIKAAVNGSVLTGACGYPRYVTHWQEEGEQ